MGVKLVSSSAGSVEIIAPTTAFNYTLTAPAVTAGLITDSAGVLNIGSGQVYKDASGNVGIGTSSPTLKLEVSNGTNTGYMHPGVGIGLSVGSKTNAPLTLDVNNTERARIDTSGNLLIGATSQINGDKVGVTFDGLTQNGIVFKTTYGSIGSVFAQFRTTSAAIGNITQNGASSVSYATSSDYRLKENVQPMTAALSVVQQLKPCTYTWKTDGSDGQGFIAHELAEIVPDCVTGEKDAVDDDGNPVYQGVDTSFLVATLTAAIQEQQALITTLTERITALEQA
jgi:hypothetical protein